MKNEEPGISPAEWAYHELKGFFYDGIRGRLWCMNCKSEVFPLEDERDSCPNDECHNFAPGLPQYYKIAKTDRSAQLTHTALAECLWNERQPQGGGE